MPKRPSKKQAIALLEKAERIRKTERRRTTVEPGPDKGDILARGAHSATFRMPEVEQERWDRAFLTEKEFAKKYGRKP